jgi:hypothetical protein
MDSEKVKELVEAQLNTFRNGVKLTALMQATLEQMDTMKHTNMYRQKLKRQMNSLELELERTVINPLKSLDSTDEELLTKIQANIELILDMTVDELGSMRVVLEEHREE